MISDSEVYLLIYLHTFRTKIKLLRNFFYQNEPLHHERINSVSSSHLFSLLKSKLFFPSDQCIPLLQVSTAFLPSYSAPIPQSSAYLPNSVPNPLRFCPIPSTKRSWKTGFRKIPQGTEKICR